MIGLQSEFIFACCIYPLSFVDVYLEVQNLSCMLSGKSIWILFDRLAWTTQIFRGKNAQRLMIYYDQLMMMMMIMYDPQKYSPVYISIMGNTF
jgi:hypothetical protein